MSSVSEYRPRAFGGGELKGYSLSRHIYLDEAGISAPEPISIVAGVIVHSDNDWNRLEAAIDHVKRHVPEKLRDGFVFHAKELFSGGKTFDRGDWTDNARWKILEELVAIPRTLQVPICIGYVRRIDLQNGDTPEERAKWDHLNAIYNCVIAASWFMKEFADGEIATIVAENCDYMRTMARQIPKKLRDPRWPKEWLGDGAITNIKDAIHFCAKDEAPLLQLADACAFVTRRYAAKLSHGEHFFRHMVGGHKSDADFIAPAGKRFYAWRMISDTDCLPKVFSRYGV